MIRLSKAEKKILKVVKVKENRKLKQFKEKEKKRQMCESSNVNMVNCQESDSTGTDILS
jgi:hypothetical protein